MGSIVNRRRVMGNMKLPYDAEIEYLESTGTQWIDTGVIPKTTTRVDLTTVITVYNYWAAVSGAYGGTSTKCFYPIACYNNRTQLKATRGREETAIYFNYTVGTKITARFNDNSKFYVNDVLLGSFTDKIPTNMTTSLWLFGVNGYNTYRACAKIYNCKIYEGDTLVRDLIPVRVGNVGYMYDKVSGQLFGNQDTGNFILGPDKN